MTRWTLLFSSLRGRIFLASALLAVLSCGVALFFVNRRVTNEAERSLRREILVSGAIVDQLRATRTETYTITARLIADSPTLKAALTTTDAPTVQNEVRKVGPSLNTENLVLLVTDNKGTVKATSGDASAAARLLAGQAAVKDALGGKETVSLLPQSNGILQVVTVPISLFQTQPQILGTLSAGFLLDDSLAVRLKEITGSDVAFGLDGRILATTLPRSADAVLASHLTTSDVTTIGIDGEDYAVLPRPLGAAGSGAVALLLRSRAEQLQFFRAIQTGLTATAIVAVALATLLSFAVARTITRPLAAITDVMREVAVTGDLTRKITLGEGRLWRDEDAQLLATTFNTLTESVARFQREMSQKERLLSLGRLSTVIAHEVRNPLMIIKGSLHALRQKQLDDSARLEAVRDINEEVERLNRIVNEVLDFARPIRFEIGPADLNSLCRDSAAASLAAGAGALVTLDLDPQAATITTDAERLRIALVNMLVNARHAVNGSPGAGTASPVTLRTRANGERVTIVIADTGAGIDPDHLAHVFDPYFTTKRGGTGLGLPIAKNIIEGLGGSISIDSTPGAGTEIRVDLPYNSFAAS